MKRLLPRIIIIAAAAMLLWAAVLFPPWLRGRRTSKQWPSYNIGRRFILSPPTKEKAPAGYYYYQIAWQQTVYECAAVLVLAGGAWLILRTHEARPSPGN